MKILLYQFHLKDKSVWNDNTDYGDYWKLSSKSCQAYAEKYGYDYIFDLHENEKTWSPWFLPSAYRARDVCAHLPQSFGSLGR